MTRTPTQIITPADLEGDFADHLPGLLARFGADGVPVMFGVPDTRPGEFITVHRNGGHKDTPATTAQVLEFECWSTTDARAERLAALVAGIVEALPGHMLGATFITRVQGSAPVSLPDPDSAQARYVYTPTVHARSTVVDAGQ